MGCRKREFHGEENVAPSSLSDALLFATVCIIGLPVDVHIKDGSIYSGIFHTACVEKDYGIVLKKARMTKKGNCDANVTIGELIETLVVESEDLVQVLAKGILLPGDGVFCKDLVESIPSLECTDEGFKVKKSNEPNTDRMQTSRTRHVAAGRAQGRPFDYKGKADVEKIETTHEVLNSVLSGELNSPPDNVDACSTQSKVDEMHEDTASKLLSNGALSDCPVSSVVKMNNRSREMHTPEDSSHENAISLGVSTSGTSFVECSTESVVSSSSTPTETVPPKCTSSTAKAFKLNPGADVFCPSFANHRSVSPPVMTTVPSVAYISDNFPVVPIASAQPEVEISSYVPHPSLSAKFAPYGNLITANGVSDSHYAQSIIGHVGSRTQPNRFVTQHHSIQAGPAYMQTNSQNVMVGRLGGQLVYMHPVTQDMNHGVAVLSQVATCPLLTQHQGHLPKHQGTASAQALQLRVTTPYIAAVAAAAGGQQQYAVQSHIPLQQSHFPVIHPIPVTASNGFFSTKFQ